MSHVFGVSHSCTAQLWANAFLATSLYHALCKACTFCSIHIVLFDVAGAASTQHPCTLTLTESESIVSAATRATPHAMFAAGCTSECRPLAGRAVRRRRTQQIGKDQSSSDKTILSTFRHERG